MTKLTLRVTVALAGMLMLTLQAHAQMVISKVFYAGTTQVGSNKNYAGGEEYIELHNNTDKEYNVAGMYIGLIESESGTGAYLAQGRTGYEVKLKQVYQLPDDREYMVKPWGTVVIAASAIDHSAVAQNGPDLSKADFEFGGMSTDNADVPNLKLVFSFNANMKAVNLTNGGDAGIVLISQKNGSHLTASDESTYVYANGKTTGNRYLPFNAYYAMDAVEILKTKANGTEYTIDATRKRLSDSQDAGYVVANAKMNKDGYVAYRRTALSHDGGVMLYDTNNSCTDFEVSNTIGGKAYDTQVWGATAETVTVPESGYLPLNAKGYFFTGKDLYIAYVSISGSKVKFNSYVGNTVIANNSPYILVGAPGEHRVYYTKAQRSLASAGADNWIEDDDERYSAGVFTNSSNTKRYPMKLVNEKGNVRFVRDMVNGNPKSMKIDLEREGRFFIYLNYLNEEETSIAWGGVTPDEVITGIHTPTTNTTARKGTYTLQGVKVEGTQLPAGIYIRDGKKIVVR